MDVMQGRNLKELATEKKQMIDFVKQYQLKQHDYDMYLKKRRSASTQTRNRRSVRITKNQDLSQMNYENRPQHLSYQGSAEYPNNAAGDIVANDWNQL